jgi:hypothetical protein
MSEAEQLHERGMHYLHLARCVNDDRASMLLQQMARDALSRALRMFERHRTRAKKAVEGSEQWVRRLRS